MIDHDRDVDEQQCERERWEILQRLEDWLEMPMVMLGFAWLALLVVELAWGLGPLLELFGVLIWIVFLLEFAVQLLVAPNRPAYLRRSWFKLVALTVPALRVFRLARAFRVLRVARVTRGIRLFRVVSSLNRGMRGLGATMARRGFGYAIALTALVTVTGAAGMYAFESDLPGGDSLDSYGAALWWTAMIMTTMGSDLWPQTPEGRMLCFLLALYAFAVFGYVTATLASFFINHDAQSEEAELAGAKSMAALREEIIALREEIRMLAEGK